MTRRFHGPVELILVDGGSEFKEAFADRVVAYCQRHRMARPYKKNEQACIESFNQIVRKECLAWGNIVPETTPVAREWWSNSWTGTTTTASPEPGLHPLLKKEV